MDVQQRLALLWLNQTAIPSALLVNSIGELADGRVITDLITLLQKKFRAVHPSILPSHTQTLEAGLQWLVFAYGHTSLPVEIGQHGAQQRIRAGHPLTLCALISFLKQRFDDLNRISQAALSSQPSHHLSRRKMPNPPKQVTSPTGALPLSRVYLPSSTCNSETVKTVAQFPDSDNLRSGPFDFVQRSPVANHGGVARFSDERFGSPTYISRLDGSTERISLPSAAVGAELHGSFNAARGVSADAAAQHWRKESLCPVPWDASTLHSTRNAIQPLQAALLPPQRPGIRVGALYDPFFVPRSKTAFAARSTPMLPTESRIIAGADAVSATPSQKNLQDCDAVISKPIATDRDSVCLDDAVAASSWSHLQCPVNVSLSDSGSVMEIHQVVEPTVPPAQTREMRLTGWLRSIGLVPDCATRARRNYGGFPVVKHPGKQSTPQQPGSVGDLCVALSDGVMLSELVAAVELHSSSRLPTVRVRVSNPAGVVHPASVLVLLPGTVLPRNGHVTLAAASKNLELALGVLRDRPRVNPRFLWSAADLVTSSSPEVALGLLSDIHKAYGHGFPVTRFHEETSHKPLHKPEKCTFTVENADNAITDSHGPSIAIEPSPAQTRPPSPIPLSSFTPSLAPPSLSEAQVLSSTALIGLPTMEEFPIAYQEKHANDSGSGLGARRTASASSQTSKSGLTLSALADPLTVPAELLHCYPRCSALDRHRAGAGVSLRSDQAAHPVNFISAVTPLQQQHVREWLRRLGLSDWISSIPDATQHTLDSQLLNGTLLAELMRRLEPNIPPLGGKLCQQYFRRPRSFAEARANLEAALFVLRASPTANGEMDSASSAYLTEHFQSAATTRMFAGVPAVYLWCAEEVLLGNTDAALGLLWHVMKSFTSKKNAADEFSVALNVDGGKMNHYDEENVRIITNGLDVADPASNFLLARLGEGVKGAVSASHFSSIPVVPSFPVIPGIVGSNGSNARVINVDSSETNSAAVTKCHAEPHHKLPQTQFARHLQEAAFQESEVVSWLSSLGLVPQPLSTIVHSSFANPGLSIQTSSPLSLEAFLPLACDGSLFVAVATVLQQRPLLGITLPARNVSVALSNIRKALDALRGVRLMNGRHLNVSGIEKAVHAGTPSAVLGILHDALRCYRGEPPRPLSKSVTGLPKKQELFVPAAVSSVASDLLLSTLFQGTTEMQRDISSSSTKIGSNLASSDSISEHGTSSKSTGLTGISIPAPAVTYGSHELGCKEGETPARMSHSVDAREQETLSLTYASAGLRNEAWHSHTVQHPPAAPLRRLLHSAHDKHDVADPAALLIAIESPVASTQHAEKVSAEAIVPLQVTDSQQRTWINGLIGWLSRLNIYLESPDDLFLASHEGGGSRRAVALEWSDGVILARVVEAVENSRGLRRGEIAGIDRQPRTAAARLGNIRRSLEILRGHPLMPLDCLWSEEALKIGDVVVLRRLLGQIRHAYSV